jgi:hypothetical protein
MDSDRGENPFRYEVRWEFISDLISEFGGNVSERLSPIPLPISIHIGVRIGVSRLQCFNKRTHFRYETDGSVSIRYGYRYEIQFFRYEVRYQFISESVSVFLVCSDSNTN